jgi:hypothetical protein
VQAVGRPVVSIKSEERVKYQTFLNQFKEVCKTLQLLGKWGCQTFRKTTYLFGVWGGGQDSDLMLSARHKTVSNAVKYKQDASFFFEMALQNDSGLKATIPKFKSLYVLNYQAAVAINRRSISNMQNESIYSLEINFVEKYLQVDTKLTWKKRSSEIGEELLKFTTDYGKITDAKKEIIAILSTLEPAISNKLAALIRMHELGNDNPTATENVTEIQEDEPLPAAVTQKRKRGGNIDIEGRSVIRKQKNNNLKVSEILRVVNEADAIPSSDRADCLSSFLSCIGVPIKECLRLHFNNEQDRFVLFHTNAAGAFIHSKFKSKRCSGGDTCGI